MPVAKSFDVLGLGCAAVDDVLYLDAYPPADAKVHVRRRERRCGGLTAMALLAANRLGARCAFAGTLGFDETSEFVLASFREAGVDVRHVVRKRNAGPVQSTIVVGEQRGTRNIFAHVADSRGADPRRPARDVIESTRVLFVDYFGMAGNLRAAKIARRAGIPIVSDLERTNLPGTRELLALIDHPIFSLRAACELSRERHPARAAAKLWSAGKEAVVVTCGEKGVWFVTRTQRTAEHVPAFNVVTKDTTGCGDVFHGAYAAALARGMPVRERIRFASAAAALKATRHGLSGLTDPEAVERFLQNHA